MKIIKIVAITILSSCIVFNVIANILIIKKLDTLQKTKLDQSLFNTSEDKIIQRLKSLSNATSDISDTVEQVKSGLNL